MVFSSHLCVGLLFLCLYSLPSPPSPWVASFSLNFTQVVSHNAHISSHTTPLISQVTQLISHNSSHSTHLTQLNSLKSCFRVAFGGAASCSLTELHPSSFTQLISQLTQLISHYSTHLTLLHSSHKSHNSSHVFLLISQLTQLISHNSSHLISVSALQQERWWGCCACAGIGTWT